MFLSTTMTRNRPASCLTAARPPNPHPTITTTGSVPATGISVVGGSGRCCTGISSGLIVVALTRAAPARRGTTSLRMTQPPAVATAAGMVFTTSNTGNLTRASYLPAANLNPNHPSHADLRLHPAVVTGYSPCRHVGAAGKRMLIRDRGGVRIAYVTESFPPDVNGVASTAMRVAEQLAARGHQPLVIAPEPARRMPGIKTDFPVVRVPSVGLPLYPGFRVGLPGPAVRAAIASHDADLVHLAGPVVLGASGCSAAKALGVPVVAVYATDMAAYAHTYHFGSVGEALGWRHLRRIHNAAARNLAPSTATA